MFPRPLLADRRSSCLAREVPPCPKWAAAAALESVDVLFTVVVPGPVRSSGQQRVRCFFLLLTFFFLSLQGSLYETSNLDRGGNNRKKKIEEFSRSSREKLVQSKNKMFSKFTSILQHAVEAVSLFNAKHTLLYLSVSLPLCVVYFGRKRPLVAKTLHIITSALAIGC